MIKAIKDLKKKIGAGVITVTEQKPLEVIPTGILPLDIAIGIGGVPRGYVTHIWGAPSSFKTTTVNFIVGEMQKKDKDFLACYIDIEHSIRGEWLKKFGVDEERTVIVPADTTENAMNNTMEVLNSGAFDLIVVDSIGSLVRAVELDGKDGKGGNANDVIYGGSSALVTRWVKSVTSTLTRLDNRRYAGEKIKMPAVIFINQQRDDLGSMFSGAKKFSGGNALEHQMYINIRLRASGAASDKIFGNVSGKKVQVGTVVTATIDKNKAAAPHRQGAWQFVYEECEEYEFGVQQLRALVDSAIEYGIITAKGAWIDYPDKEGEVQRIQGREALIDKLKGDEDTIEIIRKGVINKVRESETCIKVKE